MVQQEHLENLRDAIRQLLDLDELQQAIAVVTSHHPADQADLIEELDEEDLERLFRALSRDQQAQIQDFLDEEVRAGLLSTLTAADLIPVLDRVDEDVAADIVQDLSPEQAEQIVPHLEEGESVEELLSYPEESAGGRMSKEFVALHRTWTVNEAIEFLRNEGPDANQTFYLHVVDDDGRLTGIVG
jgi:magnesium transporter